MKAQAILPHPFTLCSSCKQKFVVCPFVNKETNVSNPFANRLNGLNGLNRLNGLAHLWKKTQKSITKSSMRAVSCPSPDPHISKD
jgi:hypothetical protein